VFITVSQGYAQTISTDGNFQVDFSKGCAPLTIEITSLVACPCNIYFDGGSGNPVDGNISIGQTTFSHTYTDAGTYDLVLVGNNLDRDHIEITVTENRPPEFTATSCNSRQVEIDITNTNYDRYIIDYADGSPHDTVSLGNNPPDYTYAIENSYDITIRGFNTNAKDECDSKVVSTKIVELLANAAISSLVLTSKTEAILEFTADPSVEYYLEIKANDDSANGFQRYLANPLTTSPLNISDNNLDFDLNYYCFRIATFDPCANAILDYSNTLCSIDLGDININNLSNNLNIRSTNTDLTEHVIWREDLTQPRFTLTTRDFFDDNNVICNTEYCYRIISSFNGIMSTSLTKCGTALSLNTPDPISNLSIDATASPSLSWVQPVDFVAVNYFISNGSLPIGETTTQNFLDTSADNSSQSCYEISYLDECGNTSDLSGLICSIFFTKKTSNSKTTLKWTSFIGWENGIAEYQLIKNGSETIYNGSDLSFELDDVQDVQKTTYQIIAKATDGSLADSKSNTIAIINRTNITFPNAFVVGGLNNEFKVVGRYINTYDLKIYSRWGELIAHITNPNTGWTGTKNGRNLPEGNYIYFAEITDDAGNRHERNGSVLLMRK
jgi:gliding motility-associated-like protein